MNTRLALAASAASLTLALTACTAGESATGSASAGEGTAGSLNVMAQYYAMTYLAQQVGDELVTVTQLVPAGTDEHSYEMSPAQAEELAAADVAIVTAGNTAAIDDALAVQPPEYVVDFAEIMTLLPSSGDEDEHEHEEGEDHAEEEHDHGTFDTHTWLNITEIPLVIDAIAAAFSEADPANAEAYAANAAELSEAFVALDTEYKEGLAACEQDTFVVTHPAFGYVAHDYGLTQVGISGLDEDTEPSPARLREISDVIAETGTTTVFFGNTSSPTVAEALATEVGIDTAILSTLTGAEEGEDYISLAQSNLEALRTGLNCG